MTKAVSALFLIFSFASLATDLEMVPTEALIFEVSAKPAKKGGGSSSIGADTYDGRLQTGWFYGSKPITTCYNSLSSFGVNQKDLQSLIQRSLKRWQDYFRRQVYLDQKRTELSPNLNFKFHGKCKGDEDLVFYFGAGPIFGNIQDLKSIQTLKAPMAYVNKTHMRRDLKWSKGYIRFINHGEYGENYPDWKKPGALEAVLTHELGHILGFTHTPNTIMSADALNQTNTSIDQGRQLVTCESCTEIYALNEKEVPQVLKELGFSDRGQIQLRKMGQKWILANRQKSFEILDPRLSRAEVIQTLFLNFESPVNNTSKTANIYGTIKRDDKMVPVIVELNSIDQNGGLSLRIVSEKGFEEPIGFQR